MNLRDLKFDLYALAKPQSRRDCIALTNEIIYELDAIELHIDAAIARCEERHQAAMAAA